jgi:hypothetical protein
MKVLISLSALILNAVLSAALPVDTLPGYESKVSGEEIRYFSPLRRFADIALLTRANGEMPVTWKAPAYSGEAPEVVYRLLTGHSTGTSGGERFFELHLNGKPLLTITTSPAQKGAFVLEGNGEAGAAYRFESREYDLNGDAFGHLCLRVPSSMVKDSAVFTLNGRDQTSRDWFMVFMYVPRLEVVVEPTVLVTREASKRQLNLYAASPSELDRPFRLSSRYFSFEGVLRPGYNTFNIPAYEPGQTGWDTLRLRTADSDTSLQLLVKLEPVHDYEFHIIHHSHNDIGYSHLQSEVERIQNGNIRSALRWTRECPEAVWHVESLWAVENFLNTASAEESREFIRSVNDGRIVLSANYANVLTGLCLPEEQYWNTEFSRRLESRYGFKFRCAMITDIPGIKASSLESYAGSGIRYLALGPNYVELLPDHGDRVGGVVRKQGDVAFYWKADPSSKDSLLVWTAGKGYSYFHNLTPASMQSGWEDRISRYCNELYNKGYPYDIVQLHYTNKADNGPVDTNLCRFVADWNTRFRSPRLVLSDVNRLFAELEERYGDKIPVLYGEVSPYWEDGAYSTASEEMRNRELVLKTLALEKHADIAGKRKLLDEEFYSLHRNIVMFHEHTWGSWCSISDPEIPFTTEQWKVKKAFLDSAVQQYERLAGKLRFSYEAENNLVAGGKLDDFSLDFSRGGLKSVKAGGRELVAQDSSGFGFFEMIYRLGVDPSGQHLAEDLKVLGYRDDKKRKEAMVEFSLKGCGRVRVSYVLDKSSGELTATFRFDKTAVKEKESLHLAFPVAMESPVMRYGSEGRMLRYGRDQLPGSNLDFVCADGLVQLIEGTDTLFIRSSSVNLFEVGDMVDESRLSGAKIWREECGRTDRLYLYLLNNYWHTNYKAWQEGRFEFSVSISLR